MSYKRNYTETTECRNCGKLIQWESVEIGNILDKIEHHKKNDKVCIRESKLKYLLGEADKVKIKE